MYEYKCTIDRVIDGDTVDVFIDLGFDIIKAERIRLLGIDTPELRSQDTVEKQAAQEAKDYVQGWFAAIEKSGEDVYVRTSKSDKYGRYLGIIFYREDSTEYGAPTEHILNQDLLDRGLAKEYDGGKR